jgi:hypothetical protein
VDGRKKSARIRAIRGQSSFERVMEMGESVYPAPAVGTRIRFPSGAASMLKS